MLAEINGRETWFLDFDGTLDSLPAEYTEEEGPYLLAFAIQFNSKRIMEPGKYGVYRTRDSEGKTVYITYKESMPDDVAV